VEDAADGPAAAAAGDDERFMTSVSTTPINLTDQSATRNNRRLTDSNKRTIHIGLTTADVDGATKSYIKRDINNVLIPNRALSIMPARSPAVRYSQTETFGHSPLK